MPMINQVKHKEDYKAPLAVICDALPDILCQSDPENWGNEGLGQGEPWTM